MARGGLKGRLYPEFARVSQALASERRLELLDVLAQAPRRVEALADETAMTIANVSQHLQVLKNARLVESERQGTSVTYRLASPSVLRLWLALCGVAEERLPEVARLRMEHRPDDDELSRADLPRLLRRKDVVLVDVRPAVEFEHGHIPGAISMPLPELPGRVDELPRDKRIVAYCRGTYCLMADDAVAMLRERGFDAVKLDGGWPEWFAEQPSSAERVI
jgi:rhodanese-related sulfurtransferase/predicted transcriptional regulator